MAQNENKMPVQQRGMGQQDEQGDMEARLPNSFPPPDFLAAVDAFGSKPNANAGNGGEAREGLGEKEDTRLAYAYGGGVQLPKGMDWYADYPHAVKISEHNTWSMADVALQMYGTRSKANQVRLMFDSPEMGPAGLFTPLPRNTWLRIDFDAMKLSWKKEVYSLLKINNRASWGAEGNRAHSARYDYQAYDNPKAELHSITLHHKGNGDLNSPKDVQNRHMHKDDKADIGYHYIIDLQGKIHEGRNVNVRGSHVGGANTGAIGILWLADFVPGPWPDGNDEMTDAMMSSTRKLIGHLLGRFPNVTYLGGHQEFSDSECPGPIGMKAVRELRGQFNMNKPTKVKTD
jgi:hypothetical protein